MNTASLPVYVQTTPATSSIFGRHVAMLTSYILLLAGLVIIFPGSLGVDPVNSDPDPSTEALERQSRNDEPAILTLSVLDLATKAELSNLQTQMSALTAELRTLQLERQADPLSGSSVYVRWGSAKCSNKSETVYSGVIGGGYLGNPGAAVNALCLSLDPVYDGKNPSSHSSTLFGSEYETTPEDTQDEDGVCAVCRVPRPTTVMIPGTNVCLRGWTLEYSGYLMAGYDGHTAASEYICVDKKIEARLGSNANNDGKLLYYTIGSCGSLPCPPYKQGKVVTCAVCSK